MATSKQNIFVISEDDNHNSPISGFSDIPNQYQEQRAFNKEIQHHKVIIDKVLEPKNSNAIKNVKEESEALQRMKNGSFVIGELIRLLKQIKPTEIYEMILNKNGIRWFGDCMLSLLRWFDFNPLEKIYEERLGCTAQCPACGVKCSSTVPCGSNKKHQAIEHLPQSLFGKILIKERDVYEEVLPQTGLFGIWLGVFNKALRHEMKLICQYNEREPCREENRSLIFDICTFPRDSNNETNHLRNPSFASVIRITRYHDNILRYLKDWSIPVKQYDKPSDFWQYLFSKNQSQMMRDFDASGNFSCYSAVSKDEALQSLQEKYRYR